MNLRAKMLMAMTVLFAVVALVFSVLSVGIMLKGFSDVEKDSARQNVDRVVQALNDRIEGIDKTARDWAWWDDVYAFAQDGNEPFIRSNLAVESMEEIEVDLIVFVGAAGSVIHSERIDRSGHLLLPVDGRLQTALEKWRLPSGSDGLKGLMLLPEGPMMMASRPILTSQQKGPPRGALIMGRFLNADEIEHVARVTRSSIRMERVDEPALPPDFIAARDEVVRTASVPVATLGMDSIAGYAMIRDVDGRPALLVRVDMKRPTMAHARKMLFASFAFMIVTGAILTVVAMFLLERLVLARVVELSEEVASVGRDGVSSTRVPVRGHDEISRLASNINQMLDGLDRSSKDLWRAREELESRVKERTFQLEEANRELESFSYSVSHDLRAPLRAIDGFSQMALDECAGKLGEETESKLKKIRAAAQRMGRVIDSLLALSRLSRRELRREHVDLSEIVRSIAQDYERKVPGREVSMLIEDGVAADGDADLLRLALENLISNAWKFTSKRAQATIEFGMKDSNGHRRYFVRDNGAGFDMRYSGKLFGAFQRLHHESDFEGTGIGLAIVQRIIHRHGGRAWAEGDVGKGATFYFTVQGA